MSKGTHVETRHLPKFQSLIQLHQNLYSGKVDAFAIAPFSAKPNMAFRLNEMMQCLSKLQTYHQTRNSADQFQYSFCLASKICPGKMDEWTSCFQECQRTGVSLDACKSKKRAAELCASKFSQDSLRLFVDYKLFS